MDTKLATTNIRIQQWLAVFKARNESGLKIDEYCVDRHSKPNQYDIEYPVIEPYYLEPLLPGRIIECHFI